MNYSPTQKLQPSSQWSQYRSISKNYNQPINSRTVVHSKQDSETSQFFPVQQNTSGKQLDQIIQQQRIITLQQKEILRIKQQNRILNDQQINQSTSLCKTVQKVVSSTNSLNDRKQQLNDLKINGILNSSNEKISGLTEQVLLLQEERLHKTQEIQMLRNEIFSLKNLVGTYIQSDANTNMIKGSAILTKFQNDELIKQNQQLMDENVRLRKYINEYISQQSLDSVKL